MERLQKVLSRAGVASRRAAERMITEGRVVVNGEVVRRLGVRVDALRDAIRVDGKPLPARPRRPTYLMLHKPRGYVTTMSDPEGRPTVVDLLQGVRRRVFPVGRLDYNSEGLLLLTDDGELAEELMHPRMKVSKTYSVKVRGRPKPEGLARLARGIRIDGRQTLPCRVRIVRRADNSWIEITVVEGRKHQVRKMLASIGHPVLRLRRIGYGGLALGSLAPGQLRPLSREEVERLRRAGTSSGPGSSRPTVVIY